MVVEVQPIDIEEPAPVLKFIERELLSNLFDPVVTYHPCTLTTSVIFKRILIIIACLDVSPAQPLQTLDIPACEVIVILQDSQEKLRELAFKLVLLQVGRYFYCKNGITFGLVREEKVVIFNVFQE